MLENREELTEMQKYVIEHQMKTVRGTLKTYLEAERVYEKAKEAHAMAMKVLVRSLSGLLIGDVVEVTEETDSSYWKKGQRLLVVDHYTADETPDGWQWVVEVEVLTKKGTPHATRNTSILTENTQYKIVKRGCTL